MQLEVSATPKAALASADSGLKDAMSTACTLHANFLLAHRDQFMCAMQNELYTGKPGL